MHTIKSQSPGSIIHISHDARAEHPDVSALRRLSDVAVEYHPGGYGDFSHVDRYMAAVDWLVNEQIPVDWLVNITGQDYPLVPLGAAELELENSGADGFMELWDAWGPDAHWPRSRVRSRYYFRHRRVRPLSATAMRRLRPVQVINRLQPLVRVHVAYGFTVGRRTRSPVGPQLRLHGGSAFASLRWSVVDYLREYFETNPDVIECFRRCLSPVEAVFPTIVGSSEQFKIIPDCKRFFDFSELDFNHPKTLTALDLPAAFASGAHFGRKFDYEKSPELLDEIDAVLLRESAVS